MKAGAGQLAGECERRRLQSAWKMSFVSMTPRPAIVKLFIFTLLRCSVHRLRDLCAAQYSCSMLTEPIFFGCCKQDSQWSPVTITLFALLQVRSIATLCISTRSARAVKTGTSSCSIIYQVSQMLINDKSIWSRSRWLYNRPLAASFPLFLSISKPLNTFLRRRLHIIPLLPILPSIWRVSIVCFGMDCLDFSGVIWEI